MAPSCSTRASLSNRLASAVPSVCLALALVLAGGCSGGTFVDVGTEGEEVSGTGTTSFFVDPHAAGQSSSLRLVGVQWGRLVNVFSWELTHVPDPANPGLFLAKRTAVLRHRDYVVGENILSDGVNYLVQNNAVTGETSLTVLYDKDLDPDEVAAGYISQAQDETEAFNYQAAFNKLTENLGPIQPKGLAATELPPFSFVPRNAALMLQFSDLLDDRKVTSQNIRLLTGYPPNVEYSARIFPDPNHGGLAVVPDNQLEPGEVSNSQVFRSTRVILDFTVSELEANAVSPPLTPNSQGLPSSITVNLPNVAVAIPTEFDAAASQFDLLRNISGTPLDFVGNGPTVQSIQGIQDVSGGAFPAGPIVGRSVVRSMRSGGDSSDKNNGFLLDLDQPRILGEQRIVVVGPPSLENPGQPIDPNDPPSEYIVSFKFDEALCALTPQVGDALELPGGLVAVVRLPSAAPVNGLAVGVPVDVQGSNPAAIELLENAQGTFVATYDPAVDVPLRRCFVKISPTPTQGPSAGVSTNAQFTVRFTEPMDPDSISAFDTLRVARDQDLTSLDSLIVGRIFPSQDLRSFRYESVLPLDHLQGSAETYFLNLVTGAGGVTDLAGNEVAGTFPIVPFQLDLNEPLQRTGNISLRFNDLDEDGDGLVETTGQFSFDPNEGLLRARAVTRQTGIADRVANPTVASMTALGAGLQTPLVPLGARMMTIWRYCDFQWSSTDTSLYNVDVERLYWTPFGGQVFSDVYEEYEITLSHAAKIPDEEVDVNLLPVLPKSGLFPQNQDFVNNVLNDPLNPRVVVHPRELGYVVDPNRLFTNTNGTRMMPWPVNDPTKIAPEDRRYFTWRDTATLGVGGEDGDGIDLRIMFKVGAAVSGGMVGDIAPGGEVPTIGLPLLMEFKCYPAQDTAVGLNSFDTSIALNSSSKPNFRVFSQGGFAQGGSAVVKNPDTQDKPTGGFNPNSQNPGAKTPGDDPVFYIGQADIVIRVSRAFTHWFATGEPADFAAPVVRPDTSQLPSGTQVLLQYRGASALTDPAALLDASIFDAYGDLPSGEMSMSGFTYVFTEPTSKNAAVTFLTPGDYNWFDDLDDLDGSSFFQVRISFISNAVTGLTPVLSALGFAFTRI